MRKVLSLVLVLALVLSSFSMAFAAETTASAGLSDIDSSANGQAIEVANNLGIVTGNPDGTFQPEKAVTRAEFAAMITRALGIPDSALAGYTSTSFKDTDGYGWAVPYLAFCQSKGIMLGDGAGNAMPGKTINTNEAATMILRGLGYSANSSALIGVWPSNYVSMAQDLGIYDDTASATNVDKQNAAQMIYNALSVQKVQVAADGTTTRLVDANNAAVTMLTSGLNCDDNGYGIVSYDADAVISTVGHVGEYAKTYDNADGDIISVDDVKSTAIVGTFVDKVTIGTLDTADEFTTDNGDTTYTIDANNYLNKNTDTRTAANTFGQFVNGAAKTITFADGKDYTFNVGLSNKSVQDLYSVEEWTVDAGAKVVAGDLNSIADGSLLGYDFATDKNDNIIAKSFELVGVASLDDIKADSVVYVYSDSVRDEISKVSVGTEVVEGTVTKVNATDSEWTVGGKVYAFGLNGSNGSSSYKNELNNDVKMYLDADGDIYKYDVTSGSAKDYASIVTYDVGGTADGNMKLYLADDSKKTYATDIDSFARFEALVDNVVFPAAGDDTADFGSRLIGYSLNSDGEIDGTYPAVSTTGTVTWGDNAADGWYTAGVTTAIMPSNTVLKVMSPLAGGPAVNLVVDPDAVVFTYETPAAVPVVTGISKVADIEKDATATLTGTVEALVRDGEVVALIVSEADCTGSSTDSYAVVSGTSQAVNSAGDKALVLEGMIDGKKIADDSVYTSGTGTVAGAIVSGVGSGYETVNLYKLKYNDDNNISSMTQQLAPVLGAAGGAGTVVTANGYTSDGYIKTGANGATLTAVADNAVFYEVVFETPTSNTSGVDEYKAFNGTIYAGMEVWAYDTDSDTDGADIIIISKNGIATYSTPTVTLGTAATITTASAVGTQICTLAYTGTGATVTVTDTAAVAGFTAAVSGSAIVVTSAATAAGTETVTVTVTDANSNTAVDTITLVIN